MPDYGSVTYLAYRVSVAEGYATSALKDAQASLAEAQARQFAGGPLWYDLVVPEMRNFAARAQSAHAKARAALEDSWALARPGGPVIRVADGNSLHWDEDDRTREQVRACYRIASDGAREALLAAELATLLLGRAKQECAWRGKPRRGFKTA